MGLSRAAFHRLVNRGVVHPHGIGRRVAPRYENGKALLDIEYAQRIDTILKDNREEQRDFTQRKDYFRKVASIPMIVIIQWRNMGIDLFNDDHLPKVKQMLDSPEWSWLRTDDKARISERATQTYFSTIKPGVH